MVGVEIEIELSGIALHSLTTHGTNAALVYPSFLIQNREVRQVGAGAHERPKILSFVSESRDDR